EVGAAFRGAMDAVGRDIYSQEEVRRRIYEPQATVHAGSSGGPFVLPDGSVAGIIFGASLADHDLGYAITSPSLLPLVERAEDRTQAGDTGRCLEWRPISAPRPRSRGSSPVGSPPARSTATPRADREDADRDRGTR